MDDKNIDIDVNQEKLKGIKGELIILAIMLIIALFLGIFNLKFYIDAINNGMIGLIISSESALYEPGVGWLLLFEAFGQIIQFFFICVVIFLFFNKSKYFRRIFYTYLGFIFLFSFIDTLITFRMTLDGSAMDFLKTIFFCLVWGLYVKKSKRVENTFVEELTGKKSKLAYGIVFLAGLSLASNISGINFSKLKFNPESEAKYICEKNYGEKSVFSGVDEDGMYLCDCKEGYEFGGIDGNTCVAIEE